MTKTNAMLLCLALLLCCREAAAAPAQLFGKSVVVSWTENNTVREAGSQGAFHQASVQRQTSVYISTGGRPFTRFSASSRAGSGEREQVGASGSTPSGHASSAQFQGNSLVLMSAFQSGGARQIRIDFDGSFGSCTANVIVGKSGGATFTGKSLASGRTYEVQSTSAGGASCSIKDGNVFAN
jgi:hypothetical protein